MARSLNKVELIGNLTRDPELRYTPAGTAVCTFGLATNRQWTTESGDKKEEAEFHRIVAWNKLAELCAQLLAKGRKVYVEGRLQTRRWTGQDGAERTTTEIVISDMIILDSRMGGGKESEFDVPEGFEETQDAPLEKGEVTGSQTSSSVSPKQKSAPSTSKKTKTKTEDESASESDDDIPF
jgi:single-strand DNA-binding protein